MTELKTDLKNRFLVIAPDRESCVEYTPVISQYIYQTIISKPCKELLLQIQEILKQRVILSLIHIFIIISISVSIRFGIPIYCRFRKRFRLEKQLSRRDFAYLYKGTFIQ